MCLRRFIPYFRPHVWRIALASVFMVLFGFFGAFNLIAAKPVIEIIFGKMTLEEYRIQKEAREARRKMPSTKLGEWWQAETQPCREWGDAQIERGYRFASDNQRKALLYVVCVILAATALKAVCEYLSKFLIAHALLGAMVRITEDLFAHIMKQDCAFFLRKTTGYLQSRITSDIRELNKILDNMIRDGLQQPITILSLLCVLLVLNWRLTLIAILVLPVAAIPIKYFSRRLRKLTRKSRSQTDMLSSHAEEALRNFQIVKIYDSEAFEVERFRRRNSKLLGYFLSSRVAAFSQSPVMEFLGVLGASAVLLYGGHMVTAHPPVMPASDFMIYIVCLIMFYLPIQRLTKMNVNWQMGRVSAERIDEMFRAQSVVIDKPGAAPLNRIERGIVFDHVGFSYNQTPVLQDVCLEIPLGRIIAIVGRSGAGKTTLVGLIPRLFDPTEGRVLVDGQPAGDFRLGDLRRRFGMVTQETILFNDTVERNIAYAETGPADRERVIAAARLAHAHDFILSLDGGKGYETEIGQAGQRLSGGQRQRIAIARAIYRDPQILIFDEATSSLDEESQRHVQAAIDNLLKGRTAIIIAHRLSTVRNADEIIVMDGGRIVERGNHETLMAARGLYWRLYSTGELETA